MLLVSAPSGFAVAWEQSRFFWAQTAAAVARHPLALLAFSAVLAAERAYLLLHTKPLERWQLALWETLLTVCRVLLCLVAIWVALTPHERQGLLTRLTTDGEVQYGLQRLGAFLGRQLHVLVWELILLAAAFVVLNLLLRLAVKGLARFVVWLREPDRRKASVAIVRNLILLPLALVYLVEIIRPAFS